MIQQTSAAEKLDSLAFQFCKIATVALIAGKYTLIVAAGLSSVLFVWAYAKGKRESKCFLRFPLLIAGIWALVVAWSAVVLWRPDWVDALRKLVLVA